MKSIRRELLLILGTIAAITAILIVILFYFVINKEILPFTENTANQVLIANAKYVGNWIKEKIDTVQVIAQSPLAKTQQWSEFNKELLNIYNESKDEFKELFYCNNLGIGLSTSGERISLAYKDYFKLLLNGKKKIVITDPLISDKDGSEIFNILVAIQDEKSNVVGIVGASVMISKLYPIVSEMKFNGQGYGWMVNENGLVISHPKKNYVMNFNIIKESGKYGYTNLNKVFEKEKSKLTGSGVISTPENKKERIMFAKIPYSNNWYLAMSIPLDDFYKNSNSLINVLYVSMIFLILSLVLIALFLSDNLSKPLKEISLKIKKLESGNLNVQFQQNRKDEIGIIQESLNNLSSTLNSILLNIQSSSIRISNMSVKIAESNEDFSNRILNDSSRIEQISATTEELTASFDLTAENANSSINIAKKTIETTEKNKANLEKTVQSVNELDKISSKIGEIMNFINKVAFQTNLLAVNASVEAARVGKEGSGFAVVASEIRSLSRKISEYSLEIGKLLSSNQMTVREVSMATENVKQSFEVMEEYINELVEKSNGISLSVVEQSDAIRQIADAIIDLSSSMQSNSDIMKDISEATSSLKKEAKYLSSLTIKYKLRSEKSKE